MWQLHEKHNPLDPFIVGSNRLTVRDKGAITEQRMSCDNNTICGLFYWQSLTLIPAWISKYMPGKGWSEITYPFLNFNGATVEV